MSTGAGEMARGKVGMRIRGRGKEGSGAVMVVVVGGGVHSHKATDAVVVVIGWSSGVSGWASGGWGSGTVGNGQVDRYGCIR